MKPRKTAWMRDEVILALDLYIREGRKPTMAACTQLSSVLRAVPIEMENLEDASFRGPESVRSKTENFRGLDGSSPTGGRDNRSKMDLNVWEEFANNPIRLRTVAAAIRVNLGSLSPEEAGIEPEGIMEAEEGAILTRVHRTRERNRKLVAAKKAQVLAETGRLACAACSLDFGEVYGDRGSGFIECHHTVAVSSLKPREKTSLDKLVLLCSNCHRILHRYKPWLEVDELIAIQAGQA
jgi:5-methylcytosine-specific restriction enzyme A